MWKMGFLCITTCSIMALVSVTDARLITLRKYEAGITRIHNYYRVLERAADMQMLVSKKNMCIFKKHNSDVGTLSALALIVVSSHVSLRSSLITQCMLSSCPTTTRLFRCAHAFFLNTFERFSHLHTLSCKENPFLASSFI